ncbi:hypothetical protein [Paraburkholderia sp. DHOC27]|uniref:hypothetical protein n=1 Tax=Paraburkholderia sp. DHOC27 TaxID=2303330 RepID=UPI000E3D1103|nr:hypothetical protein [Paraburkholderia sp. DHOC27]RFU48424.1 hypothetical protein D0B32_00820 [Paraburkholderia sp. DHOC27]
MSPLIFSATAALLMSTTMLAHAASPSTSTGGASAIASASPNVLATASQTASQTAAAGEPPAARTISGDNPVAIRDTLAKQPLHAAPPSLPDRIRKLVDLPRHTPPHDPNLARLGLDRELVFVIAVPYGVLYESKTHELTVDADLSGDDVPGSILLKKSVKGPSGRDLVIAPEAKAKGYIQHVDLIELKANGHARTLIHGRYAVPEDAFTKTHGDFAVELHCTLLPPYLKDQHVHSDPTDENPTDITTRTSTLYADVHAIWLVSPQSGTVLTKKLRLSD